jgi:hypothetical protein
MLPKFLLLLALILKHIASASTPVTWTSSPYFVSGTLSLTKVNSSTHPLQLALSSIKPLYIPYAAPLAVVSRMVALGIVDIGYRITDPYFQMKIFNALYWDHRILDQCYNK